MLCVSAYGKVSDGLSITNLELLERVATHCKKSNMRYIIGGCLNIPSETMITAGFSDARGAYVLVPAPLLSDKGKAKVIDHFIVESEL